MPDQPAGFGDFEPDDAYDALDYLIDWRERRRFLELAEDVAAIRDRRQRLAAAADLIHDYHGVVI